MAMSNYSLFSVLGIEIEYMLVNKDTLDIQPYCDHILKALAHEQVNEFELGDISISNELVLHVLELKNNGPKPPTANISQQFQQAISQLQPVLNQYNLQLLPTGAHPWMNPTTETKRWPHGNMEIYKQYDDIFDCKGHGWSNLQSMHVNLPFSNDEEFSALHNAIRIILPLLPALAASTPFLDGQLTGYLDSRLSFYGKNQARIPAISGDIIPEFIKTEAQYREEILEPMYKAIGPYDPNGILQYEWLNSRAAIPKFEYKAIEIRIIDTQECIHADIAIAKLIHAALKYLYNSSQFYLQEAYPTSLLKQIYQKALKEGLDFTISDSQLLAQWQLPQKTMTVREIWSKIVERVSHELDEPSLLALENILNHGNLSVRIIKACDNNITKDNLFNVYRQLGDCLLNNQLFYPL